MSPETPDPILGTWKLNVAQSKFAPGMVIPKERIDVYRELEGDQIEIAFGQAGKLIYPRDGGSVKILQGAFPEGISYVETLIGPGDWYTTWLRNGNQVLVIHKTISKDGKRMNQTIKGIQLPERSEVHTRKNGPENAAR